MEWLYRFTSNSNYPDPVEEIDALCTLDDDSVQAFLLLADRLSPPMRAASGGEMVGLCTSENGRLILHGTGLIGGDCTHGNTPSSVEPLYGRLVGRSFCPLIDLRREPSKPLDEAVLSIQDQGTFLNGQAFVKSLRVGRLRTRSSPHLAQSKANRSEPDENPNNCDFSKVHFQGSDSRVTVVGLDPTAGTWASRMTEGPKEMPSFSLKWDGKSFQPDKEPLRWHLTNAAFGGLVQDSHAALTCIDGPCGTNGLRLSDDLKRWEVNGNNGPRAGELALSRAGVHLFWTTENTVQKFDGASRWIARSLVLFSEQPKQPKIETHPHGAFTFFWRMFGNSGAPPKKSKGSGRQARLAILRSFIPGLTDSMVPNHDAVDAVCAALIAGLHHLGFTKPFGTLNDGGVIWMPDTERLGEMIHVAKAECPTSAPANESP